MEVLVKRVQEIPENFQVFADCREDPVFVWIRTALVDDDRARVLEIELRDAVRNLRGRDQFVHELMSALRQHLPELVFTTDLAGTCTASHRS